MPNVNAKYKLTVDATVGISHLILGKKTADIDNIGNPYEGKVEDINVDDMIFIDLLMFGPAGEWSLEVSVSELSNEGEENGEWKALWINPIKDNISKRNSINKRYKIKW